MKPRKTKDLREMTIDELTALVKETEDTLAKQRFQNSLKQLQDSAYLGILRKDIARMKTILNANK